MTDTAIALRPPMEWEQSEQINEIGAALAKAQAKIKNAKKSSDNPFFKSKYADLAEVSDSCRGPLTDNGIAVVQGTVSRGGQCGVRTMLVHTSGQWMACTALATPKDNGPQSFGSVTTYLRRYSLAGMAGVATEDDDGNAASGNGKPAAAGGAQRADKVPASQGAKMIDKAQIQQIHILKEKIGGWTGDASHPKHPYKAALLAYKDADGKPCESSTKLTFDQAKNLLVRMQGMLDRQAETHAKMEETIREPGSDDETDDGEAPDPGLLEDVRSAAIDLWGKKTEEEGPRWLQEHFGVSKTGALTKLQATKALQMLLANQ